MSCLAVSDNYIAVSRGLHIDCYNHSNHFIFNVPSSPTPEESDFITDIIISSDDKYLASITSSSKQLTVWDLPLAKDNKTFSLPRSASKIRFTPNNSQILVADKSGDVLLYNLNSDDPGKKLMGHLSLLLDIVQTSDEKYVITSDRDEKIRVSHFPNTYNIATYCLGHKEFVNHLEFLPHNGKYLTSSSGDGTVKCWDYLRGALTCNIDAFLDVDDATLNDRFMKIMDEENVEVTTLPIVHYTATAINEESSLLAVAIHSYNNLLIYSMESKNGDFFVRKEEKLPLEKFPSAIKFHQQSLYLYDDKDTIVSLFKISKTDNMISLELYKKVKMFVDVDFEKPLNVDNSASDKIKVLFKRKFDNVQQYQERKKKRLEKTSK